MKVIDPGHIYEMNNLRSGAQIITFVKRSGGAVKYEREWDGLQVQEVVRALIDRTQYLNDIIPCVETQDSIWHLRMVLFLYEARAYRRKQEELNRKNPQHDDSERMRLWRQNPFGDVPFDENLIEHRAVGEDGHITYYGRREDDEPEHHCDFRYCISGRGPVAIHVNECIDDGAWRIGICQKCAEVTGLKDGDDIIDPQRTNELLKASTKSPEHSEGGLMK